MSQITPFDTGKVKIGVYYQRPSAQFMSQDALRIQDALLRDRRRAAQPIKVSFFSSVANHLHRLGLA